MSDVAPDPLDRITAKQRHSSLGPHDKWDVILTPDEFAALVEVARAARDMRDRDQTITFSLRAALARLEDAP